MSDETTLRFLGTGNAFNPDGRGHSVLLVEGPGDASFLVDCGATVGLSIERFGADTRRAEKLFITHLHGDHIAGWPFLLLRFTFLEKRSRPFAVYGPAGTRRRLESLAELAYSGALAPGALGFRIDWHELAVAHSPALDCGGLIASTIPMDHDPSSLGYCFRLGAKTLGVSGDTRWCAGLEELIARSDVAVLECTSVSPEGGSHISLAELRAHRDLLAGRRTVLVHLADEVARALDADPLPGVTAAHDGLVLVLQGKPGADQRGGPAAPDVK